MRFCSLVENKLRPRTNVEKICKKIGPEQAWFKLGLFDVLPGDELRMSAFGGKADVNH